ncbi:N-acetylglucosamine kinase [Microbacterium gorillae]|uniref:N-acetylglucosamine kinase n=1 Tax=Microbacterium gorillae TaxID=1231063 RepID=UPI0006935128|nr:BadF/BadG/BcrA/BcrD ATPase family protein [Microbacterium gorillae]
MTVRIGIDLGKTSCRARLWAADGTRDATTAGAPGLSEQGGVDAALRAVTTVLDELAEDAVDAIGIGAAGALADPAAAQRLAESVRARTGATTVVTSDAIAAHAGAFAGADGVLLIVGTGAVAIALADGALRRVDGWGPWLGDEGSGQWIGRAGLRAALHAFDGRGPRTALTDRVLELVASPDLLPAWLGQGTAPAARVAEFAPAVLAAAAEDVVAGGIVDEAAAALATTAAAAGAREVVLHGGITAHPLMRERLQSAFALHGLRIVAARADACAGAAALAAPGIPQYDEGITRA